MLRFTTFIMYLIGLWLLLSGYWDNTFLLLIGIVSSLLVAFLAYRMDLLDTEGHPIQLLFGQLRYLPWLTYQVILSNIDVAKHILHPKLPISPTRFTVTASQKTDLGKAIYANSITLTPGTVTLGVEANSIDIHALTKQAADDLRAGEMDRRVTKSSGMY